MENYDNEFDKNVRELIILYGFKKQISEKIDAIESNILSDMTKMQIKEIKGNGWTCTVEEERHRRTNIKELQKAAPEIAASVVTVYTKRILRVE